MEGNGRGLISCTIPALAFERLRKATNILNQDREFGADIWIRDLPNTKQEYQRLGSNFRSI